MNNINVILEKLRKDKIYTILKPISGVLVASLFAYLDDVKPKIYEQTYANFESWSNKEKYQSLKALLNKHKDFKGKKIERFEKQLDLVYAIIFQIESIKY